jgi:hypothetical protein
MKDMGATAVQANFSVQVQTTMFFSQPTQQALELGDHNFLGFTAF